MVSRGGRSKGCANCRRRRVKCDETRPTCIRCKKRGLECDGPKEATWINQYTAFPPSPPEEDQLVTSHLPIGLSLAAFQDDISLAYTRKTLLRGGSFEIACNMIQFNNGFIDYPEQPTISLLRESIMSLAVTFYGSQHRQTKIKDRGYERYGKVLRQLNGHLADPHLQTTNETILTALTCMLLEIFLPTGPNNFLKHMRGIESMLEIRGPPTDPDGETALIFHGLRLLSIVGALATSRPSLYAREEWKRMPCIQRDEAGMLRHRIFTILADGTRLRHERDLAKSLGLLEKYPCIVLETQLLISALEEIRVDWVAFNESQLDDTISQLGKDIHIANHVSATVSMLYNTTHICLLEILESLKPSAKYASLRNAAAIKILKCLELKTHEQREGAPESNTIGFVATKVAWQSLGGFHSPEGRKLAKVVKSITKGVFAAGAWENKPNVGMGSLRHQQRSDIHGEAPVTPRSINEIEYVDPATMKVWPNQILEFAHRGMPFRHFHNFGF